MPKPKPATDYPWQREDNQPTFSELANMLAEVGRTFYEHGWVLGTSGNFSAVITHQPLRLAITASGVDKGNLSVEQIVQTDETGTVIAGSKRPSDEAKLHLAIVSLQGAGSVLHTHSVWGTLLSETSASAGGISLDGYEMLKGLDGVRTHEHREWLPIIENSQDMQVLARRVEETLDRYPSSHGLLLRRHGLYTWGRDLAEAKRHVEILEFLLEVEGRIQGARPF